MEMIAKEQLAKMIDHTQLKIDSTYEEICKACQEAIQYHFASVAVDSFRVKLVSELLEGTDIKVVAGVGLYSMAYPFTFKKIEAMEVIKKGADELDMLINVNALKNREYSILEEEVKGLVEIAEGRTTKFILETCLLSDEEIKIACEIVKNSGGDFVKTSTGFRGGATTHQVALMRKCVGEDMGVKASGGIRTYSKVLKMIEAGANRIGTSSSVSIINDMVEKAQINL